MGGDDLNDELLWTTDPVVAPHHLDDDGDGDDDSSRDDPGEAFSTTDDDPIRQKGKKRKSGTSSSESRLNTEASTTKKEEAKKHKKQKQQSPEQLLLQAGRDLVRRQDCAQQAAFLTMALRHYTLLEQRPQEETDDNDDVAKMEILPCYFVAKKQDSNETLEETRAPQLLERIREAVSVQKMKKWKHVGSPCVLIVCISARRAVAVLKELASLKVRAAKLFPKNGSVTEQRKQLAQQGIGLAVGTPHRLLQLAALEKNGTMNDDDTKKEQECLSLFDRTQLVVLDCELSHKQFTVCTLPDTAPHCMALLRESILPQLKNRKDCKIAFF